MKRLDALVVRELLGPWIFGVALFTALLMAGTYLGRLAEYVVGGISPGKIAQLIALLMPAILVQTFAMAVLLAALLAFGRLSSDSEIVALRAGGASLTRIVLPVAGFSIVVAALSFGFNELLVPAAARMSRSVTSEITRTLDAKTTQATSIPQYEKGRLVAMVMARDFNVSTRTLAGVVVVAFDVQGNPTTALKVRSLKYFGKDDWRIEGGSELVSFDGHVHAVLEGAVWPDVVPKVSADLGDLLSQGDTTFASYSMPELRLAIEKARMDRTMSPKQIANLQYGYYNKISLPMAALVFGVLGATLGIRNHRTGTATGFALAVAIIFGYMTLANFMNVWAQGGVFPPYVSAFAPVVVGAIVCGVVIWRRNG